MIVNTYRFLSFNVSWVSQSVALRCLLHDYVIENTRGSNAVTASTVTQHSASLCFIVCVVYPVVDCSV